MQWTVIQKIPNPALEGNYRNRAVKPFLREEGNHRCVYCAVHENKLGGIRAFHVEHYKPKSLFRALEHSLSNLFYICPICNSFKSNTWPADPSPIFDNASYPDPSIVDYTLLFELQPDGHIQGRNVASEYIISQLFFNRPQLILERRQFLLDLRLDQLKQDEDSILESLKTVGDAESSAHIIKLLEANQRLVGLLRELHDLPLYEPDDVRRHR